MKVGYSRTLRALAVGVAMAQETAADQNADEAQGNKPIIVTGTLICGSAAVGSQTIGVDQSKIEAIGAPNTADH